MSEHDSEGRRRAEVPFARSMPAELSLPAERLLCSGGLGWRTMLARAYADPPRAEQFTTAHSCDLLVVLVTSGTYDVESRKGRRWDRAHYHPGCVGVTAPGNVSVLRWQATSAQRLESLHADSIARMIATHLLCGPEPEVAAEVRPAVLGESALRRVTAYMHEHLHEDVSLDDLSAETNISKYHLLRAFAKATGFTPYRYLVRLRMSRAADLLRDTAQPVLHISTACGYRSPGQFTAAFRRHFGVSPTAFRRRFHH
ncbi:helix-turn-helix domain-containing protein [Sphaerisporangium aureirubrum]|uniref:Helix-turn-helix domain-containing protein n=1 Tax=Sphaerisporangium aureirubrum TaxID=1544736 RepID=A0ABW1NKQ4_9ACTN